ncbi:hypothetical protein QQF64_012916 [Cirrhinus molitorella]|uniref:Transposase n=1 Tax=Cirrhinus molitorella TaxID=172907 RepID=A0ABR3LPM6_9TELE
MQRLPPSGGRGKLLSNDQELAIVEMVVANNAIKLHEIQTRIVADHEIFDNIDNISLTTITRTLSKHRVRMKQLYTVPFERNSERVKELRRQYVQRVMELEANQAPHEFIYIDEAGFNLAKRPVFWQKMQLCQSFDGGADTTTLPVPAMISCHRRKACV